MTFKGPMFRIENKIPLAAQINSSVEKYYVVPQGVIVMLNPVTAEEHKKELANLLEGIEVHPTRFVLPSSFWIGPKDNNDDTAH
jgi:hypothetical protein